MIENVGAASEGGEPKDPSDEVKTEMSSWVSKGLEHEKGDQEVGDEDQSPDSGEDIVVELRWIACIVVVHCGLRLVCRPSLSFESHLQDPAMPRTMMAQSSSSPPTMEWTMGWLNAEAIAGVERLRKKV